jgi:uncharacterized LabA/DUF88 family protein
VSKNTYLHLVLKQHLYKKGAFYMRPFFIVELHMKRVAVFLDAGYFWVQLCTVILGKYTVRTEVNVDYEKLRKLMLAEVAEQFGSDCHFLRVYWYDGPGNAGKTSEHRAIDKLDDFKLRLGTRNGVGAQKGVDGLIIADLISLTQQRAITHALLITGDSDITPGVVAAQGMGLRAHLLSLGSSVATSPYLAAEVDLKRAWGAGEVAQFATAVNAAVQIVKPAPSKVPIPSAAASMPVSTLPAVKAPAPAAAIAITKAMFEAFAKTAKEQIIAGSRAGQLPPLPAADIKMLPREMDIFLLTIARKSIGRSLEEAEKRALRDEFKKLL